MEDMQTGIGFRCFRIAFAVAVLTCGYCVAQGSAKPGATPGARLQKSTGDFSIRWSPRDLVILPQKNLKTPVLSFRSMALSDWEKIQQNASGQPMQAERTYRLLSGVGPFLSVEEEYDCDCGGAHPSSSKRFRAYDLSKSSADHPAFAKLTDIFPEDAIFSALRGDPLVESALKDAEPAPSSLSELLAAIQFKQIEVKDCSYSFGPDLMTDFAFYSADANEMSVRISLSHAAETCRGQMTQIGIRLPTPPSLKADLDAARQGKSGFLMEHEQKTPVSKPVHFIFATKGYGK